MTTTCHRLLERLTRPALARVDRAAGVLRGVKVIGHVSDNGRRYTPECLRAAARLYEGKSVRIDHPGDPDEQRSSDDVFGWLRDVRYTPAGIVADLHFLKTHPMASRICEAAERNHHLYGLSHNAEGQVDVIGGEDVVTAIQEVKSVDIVADPATTRGLFESRQRKRNQAGRRGMQLKEWFERVRLLPPARRTVNRLFEGGYMDPDIEMQEAMGDEPLPAGELTEPETATPATADPASMDPAAALRLGFRAAFSAIFDDTTLDVKAKVARAKQLITTAEELLGAGEEIPEADDEEPDGDEVMSEADESCGKKGDDLTEEMPELPVKESRSGKLRKENRRLKSELAVRQLCEAEGVQPTPAVLKALLSLSSDDDRRALLEESRQAPARKPVSSTPTRNRPATRSSDDWLSAITTPEGN